MLIWRGFGFLAFLMIMAGVAIGVMIGTSIGDEDRWLQVFVGLGLMIGGIGTYFAGQQLNVNGPQTKVARWREERSQQLHAIADSGRFHLGPGYEAPRSMEEAHAQADLLVAAEENEAASRSRNQHTLFFIPMQWVGVIAAGGGLIVLIFGLVA